MGMPVLDFANPLYTFDTNHLSYTATENCYLFGSVYAGDYTLKIDNTEILKFISYTSATHCQQIPILKLSVGQKVKFTGLPSSYCNIHIYREISL